MSLRSKTIQKAASTTDPALKAALLRELQATEREAGGMDILWRVVDRKAFMALHKKMKDDKQSQDLLREITRKLSASFALSSGEEDGLNRLSNMLPNANRWDEALLRNNIFKVANSLGIRLPSGMFASEKTDSVG